MFLLIMNVLFSPATQHCLEILLGQGHLTILVYIAAIDVERLLSGISGPLDYFDYL